MSSVSGTSFHEMLQYLKRRQSAGTVTFSSEFEVFFVFCNESSSFVSKSDGNGSISYPINKLDKLCDSSQWEEVALLILFLKDVAIPGLVDYDEDALFVNTKDICMKQLLESSEPRLRLICVDLISAVVRKKWSSTVIQCLYPELCCLLLEQVRMRLVRVENTRLTSLGYETDIPLDDTTGWKDLETSLMALHEIVLGLLDCHFGLLGHLITDEVFDVIVTQAAVHRNRHVRQSTQKFIRRLMDIYSYSRCSNIDTILTVRVRDVLISGLDDNWSQIRLESCISCKSFLTVLGGEHFKSPVYDVDMEYMSQLAPRLFLNCFYAAEGVKNSSQDVWRSHISSRGKELLSSFIAETSGYYILMSQASNHMVSEAAFQAVGEIVARVDPERLRPHLFSLADAVIVGLSCQSWPIRDAACLASASLIKFYFMEIAPVYLEQLITLWVKQLEDSIWSVRENAAKAFGAALQGSLTAHGGPIINDPTISRGQSLVAIKVIEFIGKNLEKAQLEPGVRGMVVDGLAYVGPKPSFLPPAMVAQSLDAKKSNTRVPFMEKSSEITAAAVAASSPSASTVNIGGGDGLGEYFIGPEKRSVGGWGCCLDCMAERSVRPWEVSAGAVVLLREYVQAWERLYKATEDTGDHVNKQVGCKSSNHPVASTFDQAGAGVRHGATSNFEGSATQDSPPMHNQSIQSVENKDEIIRRAFSQGYLQSRRRERMSGAAPNKMTQVGIVVLGSTRDRVMEYIDRTWSLLALNHFKNHEKLHVVVLEELLTLWTLVGGGLNSVNNYIEKSDDIHLRRALSSSNEELSFVAKAFLDKLKRDVI